MPDFYVLRNPEPPWGGHGWILVEGMSMHLGRVNGLIQLERTGPYIPPISFPGVGDIIVTSEFRRTLEASGMTGLGFRPVIKRHIVESDWHTWDRGTDDPPDEILMVDEAEDYILDRPHSPRIAEQMGDLWELVLRPTAEIRRVKRPGGDKIYLLPDSWNGDDLFRANGVLYNYITNTAKVWFERHAGEHIAFEPAKVQDRI